ncbi:GIY-YIG nuclease family protein [Neptuniibacter sp. PT8_73]|uniref:GIY-YIG nuclease family protein n=1 Tax=unclassified Neptuniibacter TaxID=2630693 RepID=UPI0039F681C2
MKGKQSNWYVYILRCADETLYTGITTDLERRIRQHNGELVGGAKYTRVRRPVSLFWQEEHIDRSSASKREYEIKRLSRQKKERLAEG